MPARSPEWTYSSPVQLRTNYGGIEVENIPNTDEQNLRFEIIRYQVVIATLDIIKRADA